MDTVAFFKKCVPGVKVYKYKRAYELNVGDWPINFSPIREIIPFKGLVGDMIRFKGQQGMVLEVAHDFDLAITDDEEIDE